MCLNITIHHPLPYIADEDIPCYKLLTKKQVSPTMVFKYNYNEVYKTNIKRHKGYLITQAFHSFSTYEEALKRINWYCYDPYKVYEAIIPKGSTYFYNAYDNEFASSAFILKRRINFLDNIKILFKLKTMPFVLPCKERGVTEPLNNIIIIE